MKRAEELAPSRADVHDSYAQALQASGNNDAAIGEFQQSIALKPNQIPVMMELAAALEKKGDWPAALHEYHRAALLDASIDIRGKVIRSDALIPETEYKKAQERFNQYVASLKSAGKSAEAAQVQARIRSMEAAPGLSEKLDAAIQAGLQANSQRHFEEALTHFKEAVELADKIQPHDQRLASALDYLGMQNLGRDFPAARAAFERELKVDEEIYGPQSPNLAAPLSSLGHTALIQKDYVTAERYFFRAVDLNEKAYGEGSNRVAFYLLDATSVYMAQQDYAKAEPYILRALRIDVSVYGNDSVELLMPLSGACNLYDKWGKPDKLEIYGHQLLTVLEKQFGPNSPQLAPALTIEARALRNLGRANEATDVENRLATIRSATMSTP